MKQFFNNLSTRTRILLLSAFFLAPLVFLLWNYAAAKGSLIDVSKMELEALPEFEAMHQLLLELQTHRVAALTTGRDAEANASSRKIMEQVGKLGDLQKTLGAGGALGTHFVNLQKELTEANLAKIRGPEEAEAWHDLVVGETMQTMRDLSVACTCILDPDVGPYFLQSFMQERGPVVADQIAELRDVGTVYLANPAANPSSLTKIRSLKDAIELQMEFFSGDYARILQAVPDLEKSFGPAFQQLTNQNAQVLKEAAAVLTGGQKDSRAYYEALGAGLRQNYEFLGAVRGTFKQLMEERISAVRANEFQIIGITVLAVLIAALFAVAILLRLGRSLDEVVSVSRHLSEGNLDVNIAVDGSDEFGRMAQTLNHAIANLSEVIQGFQESSGQIRQASEQLASTTQDLSNRSEISASAIRDSVASIEKMLVSIEENADVSHRTTEISKEAGDKVTLGVQAVHEMNDSMESISESSRKILGIVEVMNTIAFQTNLLALNASIEAARAGEQGRGFAVVAVEVRKLALRSDEASKEIASLLSSSDKVVAQGAERARRVGGHLETIQQSIVRVNELVANISRTAADQKNNVNVLRNSVSSMEESTQQNAVIAEEQAATAQELSSQSIELADLSARFQTGSRSGQLISAP